MEPIVKSEVVGKVGWITMNRPKKRNALSPEMVKALSDAFDQMEMDPQVKAVILQANGPAFCAGADLEYLQEMQEYSLEENLKDSQRLQSLFSKIYEFPKMVIAKIQGQALAGGSGLVTVCDFSFASSQAKFGFTEVKIGFIPALVSVFLQERIGIGKASGLLLSGEIISAKKAEEIGLITEEIPEEKLNNWVIQAAEKLVDGNSAFSMAETKKLLRAQNATERRQALEAAALANANARSHADCRKGIAAFLSKTKPNW